MLKSITGEIDLSTVSDAMLIGGRKHGLNYSECMEILPTSNHYKSFNVWQLWIARIRLKKDFYWD